jgi:hypothetical protein
LSFLTNFIQENIICHLELYILQLLVFSQVFSWNITTKWRETLNTRGFRTTTQHPRIQRLCYVCSYYTQPKPVTSEIQEHKLFEVCPFFLKSSFLKCSTVKSSELYGSCSRSSPALQSHWSSQLWYSTSTLPLPVHLLSLSFGFFFSLTDLITILFSNLIYYQIPS